MFDMERINQLLMQQSSQQTNHLATIKNIGTNQLNHKTINFNQNISAESQKPGSAFFNSSVSEFSGYGQFYQNQKLDGQSSW